MTRVGLALGLIAVFMMSFGSAEAADKKHRKYKPKKQVSRQVSKKAQPPVDRYAHLVVNASTGEVLVNKNGDAKRYPASLTKMMTLYMTFDALSKGKLRLNERMEVSDNAAYQPETNIDLITGQDITVDQAIRALVVHSANDASVVLAEAIGGSEWNFALAMTAKARQLGMRNTVFRNANGLPDPKQFTTARDMAKLGIALRRDFPQYYPYFKTTQFSFNGKDYKSHNRVISRFEGTDGIKTGYIRASGFNVVSSVKRDGHNIVAVVMGGESWRARDDKMVALLTDTFDKLDNHDNGTSYASAEAPQSFANAASDVQNAAVTSPAATNDSAADENEEAAEEASPAMPEASWASAGDTLQPASGPSNASFTTASVSEEMASEVRAGGHRGSWGIQVGAFNTQRQALVAAAKAVQIAHKQLKDSRISVGDTDSRTHRARIANLSEDQARKACTQLKARRTPCFVYRSDMQDL